MTKLYTSYHFFFFFEFQIDHLASSQGLVIAGYYLANENFRDVSSETGHRVADKIAENFPSACLVVVRIKISVQYQSDLN